MSLSKDDHAARAAACAAFALLATQIAGKSLRDALFLSHFDVTSLPRMFVASAVVSLASVFLSMRLLTRHGPLALARIALWTSAIAALILWRLALADPALAAIGFYLYLAVAGTLVLSWFWAIVTERFDPRTAKLKVGTIAGAATLGGLAGGFLAERVGALRSATDLFPLLAGLHLIAAFFVTRIGTGEWRTPPVGREDGAGVGEALALLRTPVLRNLALLVGGLAASAVLVDYVFKVRSREAFSGQPEILRFFAVYYAGASLLTFGVHWLAAGRLLQRRGLAVTAATLPAALACFGLGTIVWPGLATITAARAAESTLRSSTFRASYELFYTPISRRVKRATKTLIDVGFDRLGESAGALVVSLVLAVGLAATESVLLTIAVLVAVACVALTPALHRGYVSALEERLLEPGGAVDPESIQDDTTRTTVLRTMRGRAPRDPSAPRGVPLAAAAATAAAAAADPLLSMIAELRSGDASRVRRILAPHAPLDPALASHLVRLLAWDAVAADAGRALAHDATRLTGQLSDALLDPEEEFAIRRRIPRLLARSESPRAAAALLEALADARFEVRYRAADALTKILERRPEAALDSATLISAVLREAVDERSPQGADGLLDRDEGEPGESSNPALKHVFRLLRLAYPSAQLGAAFTCLERGDARLRGTAVEYLETLLPSGVQQAVVAFVLRAEASRGVSPRGQTPASEVEQSLEQAHRTIQTSLSEIRRSAGGA